MKYTDYTIGENHPFVLIAGPCVIESRDTVFHIANTMKELTARLGIPYIFKASFDKANRSSLTSFRGLGREEGLRVLADVKAEFSLPLLTDVHGVEGLDEVASVVDVLQIPAFLCRQTDLILAASKTQAVNVKGQFLSPWEMKNVADKARSTGNPSITLCERGCSFGYHNLVVDMRSLAIMREFAPVIFDVTHSVQLPGQQGHASGGQREFIPALARAAMAVGVAGLFMETHPKPEEALSDGPNSWPLSAMEDLLVQLKELDQWAKSQ